MFAFLYLMVCKVWANEGVLQYSALFLMIVLFYRFLIVLKIGVVSSERQNSKANIKGR